MGEICMTDAGMIQDNFILPALPVGGLPISQDWLDKKTHFRITIPIIYNKAWRHESESVKIMNLDADAFLISSKFLSAVKIDAESDNLMDMLVSDGKTRSCHRIPIP